MLIAKKTQLIPNREMRMDRAAVAHAITTTTLYLNESMRAIDAQLGIGYAKANPMLLTTFINCVASQAALTVAEPHALGTPEWVLRARKLMHHGTPEEISQELEFLRAPNSSPGEVFHVSRGNAIIFFCMIALRATGQEISFKILADYLKDPRVVYDLVKSVPKDNASKPRIDCFMHSYDGKSGFNIQKMQDDIMLVARQLARWA